MLSLRRYAPRMISRARLYTSGDSGSFRGNASGDSFTKREKAQEDLYVKQLEKETLKKLREELAAREKDIADLKAKVDDFEKK